MPPRGQRKDLHKGEADVLNEGGIRYSVLMGKKLGLVVVAALMLAGCASGEPESAPTVTVTATPEATVEAKVIEVSPTAPEAAPVDVVDEEARYLKGVKPTWHTEIPSDEDLLSAAALACEEMRAGTQPYELGVVKGGTPEDNAWHSQQVGAVASSTICPEVVPNP